MASVGMLASVAISQNPCERLIRLPIGKVRGSLAKYWQSLRTGGFSLVWVLMIFLDQAAAVLAAHIFLVLCGFMLMAVIGRAYMVHARPAWNGRENVLELLSVVLGLGFSAGVFLGGLTPSLGAHASTQSSFSLSSLFCAFMLLAGAISYILAQKIRLNRLSLSLAEDNSFKVRVDLENYKNYQARIRLIVSLQGFACLLTLSASFFAGQAVFVVLWLYALLAEVFAQALARHLFYSLPVPTKHVPRWR